MFRDESFHVISKATKVRSRKKNRSPSRAHSTEPSRALNAVVNATASVDATRASLVPISTKTAAPLEHSAPFHTKVDQVDPLPRSTTACLPRYSAAPTELIIATCSDGIWDTDSESSGDTDDDSPNAAIDDEDMLPLPNGMAWPSKTSTRKLYTLPQSMEQQGMAYFFAQYVTGTESGSVPTYDFVFDVWRPPRTPKNRRPDGVKAAMIAVGLAGLSSLKRSTVMMRWARKSYVTALRLTSDSLNNSQEATKDSTMLSVLILSTYELMTGRSPHTVHAWQDHVNGAAALAVMRGTSQFASKTGIRMFKMLAQTVLMSCVQRGLPMPGSLVVLRDALDGLVSEDPSWEVTIPVYRVLQLRYDIEQGQLASLDIIIEQLMAADNELSTICENFPKGWKYKVVNVSPRNDIVFDKSCHVYASPTQATTWNGLRSVRMLIHETIIREILKPLGAQDTRTIPVHRQPQFYRSARLLELLRDAVLASVPQHFGVVKVRDLESQGAESNRSTVEARRPAAHFASSPQSFPSPATSLTSSTAPSPGSMVSEFAGLVPHTYHDSREDGTARFMTLTSAGNTIVWPLYVLGMSSSCTPEVKEYVMARLLDVHRDTGLVQAHTVAEMVAKRKVSVPWTDMLSNENSPLWRVSSGRDTLF